MVNNKKNQQNESEAIRKNIYIPAEKAYLYEKLESLAKDKDTSISNLLVQYIEDLNIEYDLDYSEVILIEKNYTSKMRVPEKVSRIKFIGKKIVSTEVTPDLEPLYDFDDFPTREYQTTEYTVYKLKSSKVLLYTQDKTYREDPLETVVIGECFSYEICSSIEELVEKSAKHLPKKFIEELFIQNSPIKIIE